MSRNEFEPWRRADRLDLAVTRRRRHEHQPRSKTGPAPQSIPFASRVRCLVALSACRRRTALGPELLAAGPASNSTLLSIGSPRATSHGAGQESAPALIVRPRRCRRFRSTGIHCEAAMDHIAGSLPRLLRRAALGIVAAQAATAGGLIAVDSWRKRMRPREATF